MAPDPYRYFRLEAQDLLAQLGRGVLDLERRGTPELISSLLRFAHTLKGAARVVKQPAIADLAHGIEDGLAPWREGGGSLPRGTIDALLGLLDAIGEQLKALPPPAGSETSSAEEGGRTIHADAQEVDAVLEGLAAAHVELAGLEATCGLVERSRHTADLVLRQLASLRGRETAMAAGSANAAATARTCALAEDLAAQAAAAERGLGAGLERLRRELAQARQGAERLRLLPAGNLFTPLERAARDAAQTLGTVVSFAGRGGEVRLDAHVLAAAQRALLQMVRNAVAHGIEPAGERRKAGKPAAGTVVVEVVRRGNRVAFSCRDDGRGIDLEAVRRAAQGKGLLTGSRAAPAAEELVALLLRGGLSTSGRVTEMSGRGVGLDVVREVAASLGGEVRAETSPGRGTVVELVAPVSVSSFTGLMVEFAGTVAALPLDAVMAAVRITAGELAVGAEGASLLWRDEAIPFVPLEIALGRRTAPSKGRAWTALVVGAVPRAFGVDRLAGVETILLRPLPWGARASAAVLGASIDVAGNPRLVLDPEALAAETMVERTDTSAPAAAAPLPILVIDDSLTTRMLEQSILESAGYQVDVATSGEEALDLARRRPYGLFLVDIEMPGMDGFTFLEQAGSDPGLRGIPGILVSSRSSAEDLRRGEGVGARGYVVKSEFDQVDLLRRIDRLVR